MISIRSYLSLRRLVSDSHSVISSHVVYHENFTGVLFCGLAIFCGFREQIFAVRDD